MNSDWKLRMALLIGSSTEAKKNDRIRLIERIACAKIKIEIDLHLTFKFASNDFAGLEMITLCVINYNSWVV